MQRRYVNIQWKKFNKGQRLCWNSNNWRKTALQDLILNMATSSCLQSMMDSDTLAKGVEISLIALRFQSQRAAIILRNLSLWNAKRRPMILCLGLWLWWGFQMIRSHCQACQLFWDCNKHSVCNTQHAGLNVSWSGRRVGLMDFDKLRESDCKRFWLFTHLQFVSTVAVLIPVAPYKSLPISPALMHRRHCFISALIPRIQIHCHTLFYFLEPFVHSLCRGTFSSLDKILSQTWTCNPLPNLATHLLKSSSRLAKHCPVM